MRDLPSTPAGFPADAFAGTAHWYARFRPPYPQRMISDLAVRARLGPRSQVLDLACGPGRLGLALAPYAGEIVGVDIEPEMIAEAVRLSEDRGVKHVRWVVSPVESFQAPAQTFDLITIADGFHRLDRPVVADLCLQWLRPGGSLAVGGGFGPHTGELPWQRTLQACVAPWIAKASVTASLPLSEAIASNEDLLRAAGYIGLESLSFSQPIDWTIDEVLGFMRSTSFASFRAQGDLAEAFEREVRSALAPYASPALPRVDAAAGYTIARKRA